MRRSLLSAVVFSSLLVCGAARAGHYREHDLTSDGFVPADNTDPNLVNSWGLASSPTGPWWVADNGTGLGTVYDADGTPQSLVVQVPGAGGPAAPTGLVFNDTGKFWISDFPADHHVGSALFIFASEDGTISGWSPSVPPPPPSTHAFVAVDNSASGAVYKGLALARDWRGKPRLYATDFHNNKVDVFDGNFDPIEIPGAFTDPHLPCNYAPFGIANIHGRIFVTYAQQDEDAHDDVKGPGHGFIDEFDTEGNLLRRVASRGALNSPWGLVEAPARFGRFSHDLLVGNFGDGVINAYEPRRFKAFEHEGALRDECGDKIAIDGLWSLAFGNGGQAGNRHTLFFTAGPDDEQHGLFGRIRFVP